MTGFTDVDECALAEVTGLLACQSDEECTNTLGSFSCSCPTGYVRALHGQGCVGTTETHIIKPKYKYFCLRG